MPEAHLPVLIHLPLLIPAASLLGYRTWAGVSFGFPDLNFMVVGGPGLYKLSAEVAFHKIQT